MDAKQPHIAPKNIEAFLQKTKETPITSLRLPNQRPSRTVHTIKVDVTFAL
jgi:hypothetical protein